jgi:chromosome partitioning protein
MASRVIAVLNQKGGAGKTTTTMSLAGGLVAHGYTVLVVDADESNNAMAWAGMASEDSPFPATVVNLAAAGGRVAQEVRKHAGHYDFILCDGPPSANSPVTQSLAVLADLIIIPVQPTGNDNNSLGAMIRVVEQAQAFNERLVSRLLFNRVQPDTMLHKALIDRMSRRGIPPFHTQVKTRVAYGEAMVQGTTVQNLNDPKAQQEAEELTLEVLDALRMTVEA